MEALTTNFIFEKHGYFLVKLGLFPFHNKTLFL